MKIYLMRHGEASFSARHDDQRELTDNGRAKIQANISQKKTELLEVKLFLCSPVLRAKQTADLALEIINRPSSVIQEVEWLVHESIPSRSILSLSKYAVESIMLFSHQPFASRFVELLCDLELGAVAMNTASIIAIDADPVAEGFGKILWQLL